MIAIFRPSRINSQKYHSWQHTHEVKRRAQSLPSFADECSDSFEFIAHKIEQISLETRSGGKRYKACDICDQAQPGHGIQIRVLVVLGVAFCLRLRHQELRATGCLWLSAYPYNHNAAQKENRADRKAGYYDG
jgi:hypothetical protein